MPEALLYGMGAREMASEETQRGQRTTGGLSEGGGGGVKEKNNPNRKKCENGQKWGRPE